MAWSSAFITWLDAPVLPRFALRCIDPPSGTVTWLWASSTTKADSHTDMTGEPVLERIRQTSAMRLDPSRWVVAGGEWQVTLAVPETDIGTWLTNLRRGLLFQILAGPHTWPESSLEPIASCVLYGVQVKDTRLVLTMRSALTAMGGRLTTSPGTSSLFHPLDDAATRQQTTVATAWTVGAGDLEVASTTGFDDDSDNAGVRMLLCDPGGTPGTISSSAFYLRVNGTGTGPVRFTAPDTVDLFGTTRANLGVGDPVYEVPYVFGHPVEIAAKIATTTGAAVNGAFDTLGASAWGLRLPVEFVDVADTTEALSNAQPTSGTYRMDVIGTEPVEDPLAWMQNWLSPHGIAWTMRHGKLTMRAPSAPGTSTRGSVTTINDSDIISLDYQAFDPSRLPWREVRWRAPDTSFTAVGTVLSDTLPVNSTVEYAVPYLWSNVGFTLGGMPVRLGDYVRTTSDLFTIRARGWRLAQLAPGDEAVLTSDYYRARPLSGSTAISARPVLVLGVSVSWTDGRAETVITAVGVPDS